MSLWPYLKLLPTVPAEFGDVTPLVRLQSLSFFEGFSADVARELWIDSCGSGQFRCSPSGQQLLVVVNLFVTWPMVWNRNKLIVDQDCSQSHFYLARINTLCAFIPLWGTVQNGYRERPTLKMTPPYYRSKICYIGGILAKEARL